MFLSFIVIDVQIRPVLYFLSLETTTPTQRQSMHLIHFPVHSVSR